jgi:hypothetical protein
MFHLLVLLTVAGTDIHHAAEHDTVERPAAVDHLAAVHVHVVAEAVAAAEV